MPARKTNANAYIKGTCPLGRLNFSYNQNLASAQTYDDEAKLDNLAAIACIDPRFANL